jgi:hypothetical protein
MKGDLNDEGNATETFDRRRFHVLKRQAEPRWPRLGKL